MGTSTSAFLAAGAVLDPTGPIAASDLSAKQYYIVKDSSGIAVAGAGEGYGVLQSTPESGDQCVVAVGGLCRVKAGGTIARHGAFKSAADGEAVAATTGDDAPLGIVLEPAVDGQVVWAVLNFNTAQVN
jgi:hypothetical protein